MRSCLYIVLLVNFFVVDHFVVVSMTCHDIIDSSKRYHLTFSAEVLRICGVNSASNLDVKEVREVVRQTKLVNPKKQKSMKAVEFIE